MTKTDARKEQQFCSRCHAWGPADAMQPLYRSKDAEAGPWLWMHHHCAEICSNMQFEAAMKRFESQVDSLAESQGRGAAFAKVRARANFVAAADRAANSLQVLKRAKAALEIANIDPEDGPRHDGDHRPDRPHARTGRGHQAAGLQRAADRIEREQRELRDNMKTLAELLTRAEH